MMSYEIICGGAEAIAMIAPQWTALCNEGACADPFLRPEWFSALARTFKVDLKLVTVRRDGQLRAVLPLAVGPSSVHGLSLDSIHSAYNLNTPRFGLVHGENIGDREAVADQIWRALGRTANWQMFETRMTPRTDWVSIVAERAAEAGQFTGVWDMDPAPFVSLKDPDRQIIGVDDFFKGARKRFGRELDRRLRRLTETGKVRFSVRTDYTFDSIQNYLDLETHGWKGRAGTAAVQDAQAARLHHEFASLIAEAGKLRIYELTLDGQTIAMSLNILDGGRVFHWKTTYDEAFAKFAPGNLLFRRLLEDAVAEGLDEIDLLSPSTANKRVWATGEREHAAFYIMRPSFLGRLAWIWKFGVIDRFRGLRRSLSPA